MGVDVEARDASMTGGKMAARACDACMGRSRASWYCPADDAFLCLSCDASVHSANHLVKQHERVRLQSSSSPELMMATKTVDKTTSVWYEGFRKKARTHRSKGLAFEKLLQIDSNDPLVPELGREEGDGFFSLSYTDENEESLKCCVPVFDPFSDMVIDDINCSFGLVSDRVMTSEEELGELERAIMCDEGLMGFLPLDMDLEELTMDVEILLDQEDVICVGLKEPNDIGLVNEDNNIRFEINCKDLKRVKDEEVEEARCEYGGSMDLDQEASEYEDRKTSLFLKLDYKAVISVWENQDSPWKTEIKPEFNLGDGWQEYMLGRSTCPSHVMGGFDKLASTVGLVTHQQGRDGGGSDGERKVRLLRYKEKRRTRLFAKKIRYEVRKLNAEQRPRIKGRFVRKTSLLT